MHGDGTLLDVDGYRTLHSPQAQGDLGSMYPWLNHTGTVDIGALMNGGWTEVGAASQDVFGRVAA